MWSLGTSMLGLILGAKPPMSEERSAGGWEYCIQWGGLVGIDGSMAVERRCSHHLWQRCSPIKSYRGVNIGQ
jgi:hypothetical protein